MIVVCGSTRVAADMAKLTVWCPECRRRTSYRAGSLLENSNVAASVWLWAAWLAANTKNGVSSLSLERALGIGHAPAWYMLHKMRCAAMDQTGRIRMQRAADVTAPTLAEFI